MNRKHERFTWKSWDYDLDGEAYIIAKSECENRDDVPEYIIREDCLDSACKSGVVDDLKEGWCKFQVRSDWENYEGNAGWYVVREEEPIKKNGWFPVWIIRKGEWY